MYYLLLLIHVSIWTGKIDQNVPIGVFANEEMCETQGKLVETRKMTHLCVRTDNPNVPQRD